MYCEWPLLGRCCFCLPLRKGVLIFAYVSLIYYVLMISLYSFTIHSKHTLQPDTVFLGRAISLSEEVSIALYCLEMIFNVILIYGAHKKSVLHLKMYYYFTLTTMLTMLILQIIDVIRADLILPVVIELFTFLFVGLCLNLYLITVVRSLLKKLEIEGPHVYGNQLHQIVSGEIKIEPNGIYNNPTVVPAEV